MVEYIDVTSEIIKNLAGNLRKQDIVEIEAAHTDSHENVITESVAISSWCKAVHIHGDFVGIVGVVHYADFGVPWFLGTDHVNTHGKLFMIDSRKIIDDMLLTSPVLCNMVHHDNSVSIKWLKALGFTIDLPIKIGHKQEIFYKFHKRCEHV